MFDPIPPRWLHLTTQGVGFTDEVTCGDLDAIATAVQQRVAKLEPFSVTIGPAFIDAEAFAMPVRPVEPLARLRAEIRAGIADVWGEQNVPEAADGFRPHVSLGYSNQAGPAQPAIDELARHPEHTAEITITNASLIELNRDNKMYEWTDIATAPRAN